MNLSMTHSRRATATAKGVIRSIWKWALRDQPVKYWQDVTPGIKSFKADILPNGVQAEDRLIAFHGKPRPWEQTRVAYATA